MKLSPADRARLAHRALRLRENGVDSESKLVSFAKAAAKANREPGRPRLGPNGLIVDETTTVGAGANPLGVIAFAVQHVLDEDLDGPTDRKLALDLLNRSIPDIYREWEAAVTENVQTHHPEDYRVAVQSQERDRQAYEDRIARMLETGDFPSDPVYGHNRLPNLANALFDEGRAGFLSGEIDWDTAVIRAILVDSADYVVNLGTHKFLSSVILAAREETSAALTTKTVVAGVADADDTSWPAAAGDPCEAVILVQSSAVAGGADVADTGQRLIGYADTYTGLPVTLNGGAVNMVWDSGANRIFKL